MFIFVSMRSDDLSQPAGGALLTELLGFIQDTVKNSQFNGLYYYKMRLGSVGEYAAESEMGINKTSLHQPSYNLEVYYNRTPFIVAHYQFDKRFSMEMSEEEAERIEDYLANDVIGLIGCNGILFFLTNRLVNRTLFSILKKESDDKKFMSLN